NQAATTSGWLTDDRLANWQALPAPGDPTSENYVNLPSEDDLYSLPQNLAYALNDVDRERLNGQLVLQWAPTDNLVLTLDYTYSELEIQQRRSDISTWFIQTGTSGTTFGEFTDGPISTPLEWSEAWAGRDIGFGGAEFGWKTELDSIGFNAEWDLTPMLRFHLDAHNSTSESKRASEFGSNAVLGGVLFATGGRATVDYRQDLPVLSLDLPPGDFDASNILTGGASYRSGLSDMEIDQIDLGGVWDFNDFNSLDFGVTSTDVSNRSAYRNVQYDNWGGIGSPDDYPDELFMLRDIQSLFDQVSGSDNPNLWNQMYTWDFASVVAAREAATGQIHRASDDWDTDLRTEEESMSAYLQWRSNFEMFGLNTNLRLGVRYEQTDVTSTALVPIPLYIDWVAANEYSITFGDPGFTTLEGDYDYFLPNLDLAVNVTEDFIVRGSFTQSIGRPDWQSIQGGQTLNPLVRRDFGNGSQGNPALNPLESDNFDVSFEWYYGEGSYASVAYFYKDTSNYIGFSLEEGTPFNLPHPGNGQWYAECDAATGGAGDQGAIRQCIFETYGDQPGVVITGTDVNGNFTGTIRGDEARDPAANFLIQVPSNQEDATIDGWEFAIQHIFGESGFGLSANYTVVDSDIEYDNANTNDQFAILGLSDSANLVAFYDKNGLIVRLAYNWRDDFLNSTTDAGGRANPIYVEEYGQLDAIVSYQFENGLTLFAEAFNLTDEYARSYGRREEQVQFVTQLGPRYGIGVRWNY
ncbi:MAG: TonB-dependent receptor, partial [Pseudomonadota bacterium]